MTPQRRSTRGLITLALALATAPAPAVLALDDAEQDGRLMGQPVEDFAARRKALMEKVKEDAGSRKAVVILRGTDNRDREDFEEGRFRQTNNFAYLTGIEIPGAYLVLLPEEGKDILYLPPGRLGTAFSGGDRAIPEPGEETAKKFGFSEVASTGRLLGDVFTAIGDPIRAGFGSGRDRAVVYTNVPSPRASETNPEARFVRFLKEGAPSTEFKGVGATLGELRKIKSKGELEILQRTIDITGNAERAVMETIRPGIYEYELEGALMGEFLKGGAFRPGFASIVGSGPNACIPHYFENDRKMEDGDLVVVDIGAEVENYTADITRTFPVSGEFTDRQRELYQLVLDCQQHCADQMKCGETRLGMMTQVASAYLRQSPLRAKDSQGREQTMDRFFIHGLSHYLGMDVHDVGEYGKPMQPGEVFTIEPGLYIPGENIGIRIEDDYLMTEEGPVKLSKGIPSEPDEIERIIAEARKTSSSRTEPVGAGR
jgi:Xaa-Pro aminopeptidase